MNYLNELNESQQKAVLHIDGPVMIIAGAGSGKTRVLTYRIAHQLQQGTDPFNILALTFTNKAAKSMKERIMSIAGNEAMNLWMGTFHSVFAKILRVEAHRINYPSNFTIYDTDDSINLMKDIIKEQNLDDKTYKPSYVYHRISNAKNNLISVSDYQESTDFQNDDRTAGRPQIGMLYELYSKRCFNAGAMDFDDLLYKTYYLLKDFPDVLHKYQHKFKYVLVDEFQDTNLVQYLILKKLAALNENICVVGDDAQSIYAFRGATIQNILNFAKDYPDLATFKLEQNYRSTKTIVNAANSIITNNKHQLKKTIWTDNVQGEKIKLFRALSDNEEGNMVANAVFQDKMNEQLKNKDFAVLYRTNAQSRAMEEALRRMNIPYRIYGGLSFYKRKEIKDLLAYFRLTINHQDEEALKRIINYPARGIGKTTLEKIVVVAAEQNTNQWAIIENLEHSKVDIGGGAKTKIAEFITMLKSFATMLKTSNAYELATHIATSTGILKELYNDKTPEGVSRYENIQELLNGIKEFSEKSPSPSLPKGEGDAITQATAGADAISSPLGRLGGVSLDLFMQDIALLTDADEDDKGDNDRVSLMTIHAAKGLEFTEVFIVGLEENLFPSQYALNDRDGLEEERRLFYVAVTRAEKKLYLSYSMSRYRWGNLQDCEPSRFLEEIDSQYIDSANSRKVKNNSWNDDVFEDEKRSKSWRQQSGNVWQSEKNTWSTSNKNNNKQNTKQSPIPIPQSPTRNLQPLRKIATYNSFTQQEQTVSGDDMSTIQIGMNVEHQRFGVGKVIHLEGKSPDIKATIFFQNQGQKQVLLRFAKLKIV